MLHQIRVPGALCVALILGACASVSVERIKNDHGSVGRSIDADTSGVRFFRPALHVWITNATPPEKVNLRTSIESKAATDKSGDDREVTETKSDTVVTPISEVKAYTARFEWLPDYSQEYIVTWSTGLGSVNPSFTLASGWNMTAFNSSADSKFAESLSAVGSVVSAAKSLTEGDLFKGAGLYRMKVDSTGKLSLGPRVLALE